jgi:hypothetical protein
MKTMKGLELSRRFYLECGEPMLREQFGDILDLLAVGLVGSGSECFGYDDIYSQDHDFEPGFCIFLPDESIVDRKRAFALERAYSKLPQEFMGYQRSYLSPVGGDRHGVIRISEFVASRTGSEDGILPTEQYFAIPEQALAELTNGEIFYDGLGQMSEIRQRLSFFPEDVRLKKLAGSLLIMGQAGQYNYRRCIARGESAAAQLAAHEFVKAALAVIFLLNKRYMPYYKWSFRALSELERLSELAKPLEYLISSGNSESESAKKSEIVEQICRDIALALKTDGLVTAEGSSMEELAYSVNSLIADSKVRNLHILYAI